jgi:hypothetical protein
MWAFHLGSNRFTSVFLCAGQILIPHGISLSSFIPTLLVTVVVLVGLLAPRAPCSLSLLSLLSGLGVPAAFF